MKKQIASISIIQSSKISTAMYFVIGLLYTLIGVPMVIFGHNQVRMIGIFNCFGPIFMAIFGFIFFVIFAAIYNVLAGMLGGFEFEVKDVDSLPPLPPQ